MGQLILNSSNISQNHWVWDFLCQDLRNDQHYWTKNTTYSYKNIEFKFAEDIFARRRKNQKNMVFEMLSESRLGSGWYGSVYPISLTISMGKNGFQARNKNRVVKIQHPQNAIREYNIAYSIQHLHIKRPTQYGYMVMKNLGSMTLSRFLRENNLSNYQRLDLTKALLKAYKEQVLDLDLYHNDLHRHKNNILVKTNSDKSPQYEINIVDYALAEPANKNNENNDFWYGIAKVIYGLWDEAPKKISDLFNDPVRRFNVSEYYRVFDDLWLAPPLAAQESVDKLQLFFDNLALSQEKLANSLKAIISKSLATWDVNAINEAIIKCRAILEQNIHSPDFPIVNLGNDHIFNRIENYYNQLEEKAKNLEATEEYQKEGEELSKALKILREKTLDAIYSKENRTEKIKDCQNYCVKINNEHKKTLEIHRNYNYIFAEIAVILSSLIIFYPLFLGIHYARTGRLGFFSEANSAIVAKELENDIEKLNVIMTI